MLIKFEITAEQVEALKKLIDPNMEIYTEENITEEEAAEAVKNILEMHID